MITSPETQMPFYTLHSSLRFRLNRTIHHWRHKISIKAAKDYKPQIRKVYGTDCSDLSGRVCVFSHYDRKGQLDPHVLKYLAELKKLEFNTIVVSTAAELDSVSIEKSRDCCDFLFIKDNFGYDFGSWKAGLDYLNLDFPKIKILLLANDSVYGPLNSLEPVFEKMHNESYDLFGITDSLQLRYHIQSYFMAFSAAAVNSPTFAQYWEEFPYLPSKQVVIWAGETGLSQTLLGAGFKVGAYIQYQRVRDEHPEIVKDLEYRGRFPGPLNLCYPLWKLLITEYRCPFIKVNLLSENPSNVLDISNWSKNVEESSDYEVSLIQNHLDRISAIEAPN